MTLEGEYENNNYMKEVREKVAFRNRMLQKFISIIKEMKLLFSQPYLKYLFITCFADFGLMASYYTLIMWFPEIFDRYNQYELSHPGITAGVCVVSEYTPNITEEFFPQTCDPAIEPRVFLDTIIIGLSCIPTSVLLSYFMKKLGKKAVLNYVEKAQSADFETAIHYAKYGKFQTVLLAVCGTIYATCAISTTTLSFVLPSAKCDFALTSVDKGKLSAMPLIGMIFGCGVWGSLADTKGRKTAIMSALLMDFLAAVISSFSHNFQLFLVCRFFNGFGIIGATSIIFSYLGEFTSIKHRDTMLGRLEVFWNVGVILLPGLAWLLLNRSVLESFGDNGNFSPWRIFVLVCSLPSLISLTMLYFLPETPKFLISKKKFEKAKLVFQRVFTFNTGQPYYFYPVMTLEGEYENNNYMKEVREKVAFRNRMVQKFISIIKAMKLLFSQPYLKYLFITCFADFGLMASYYTLIMWFPEIFDRYNQYELSHPGITAGVCVVSEYTPNITEEFFPQSCDPAIEPRVFLDTIIIGLSCIPTSVSLSYFMKKLGKKAVLICGLMLAGLSTLSLNWVQSTTETLVLSCVFEALTSILEAVIFCVIVDLFPTNLRAIALAVTATTGRVGAILGNVVFGFLIDLQCAVPMYLFGTLLIASGMLCVKLPHSDSYLVIH